MDFASTRIGQEICSKAAALLGRKLREKQQYMIYADAGNCSEFLREELEKGARFVDKIYDGNGGIILIFEKDKR